VEAAVMKATEPSGGSKLWQSLTGLSDDVLMAGMNMKEKHRRALERSVEKNAAENLAASVSMLTKMSEVRAPDRISGGKADGKPASKYDPHELEMGKKVEQEHTNDPQLAEEIAKDHLEEIRDYYTRLKRMEDSAPKSAALGVGPVIRSPVTGKNVNSLDEWTKGGLFHDKAKAWEQKQRHSKYAMTEERPMYGTSPMNPVAPDILQLLKAQALIEQQQKMAQINDPGDGPHLPYQPENENSGDQMPMGDIQDKLRQQAMLEQMYSEQMRAKQVEDTYKGKVRKGEIIGGVGGLLGGGILGHMLSAGTGIHAPATFLGAGAGGLLGKHIGQGIGQRQGMEYLQQYSGVPWGVQG
jgi:hypothetical protein